MFRQRAGIRTVITAGLIIKAAFTCTKRVPLLTPLTPAGFLPSYQCFYTTATRTESFSSTFIIPRAQSQFRRSSANRLMGIKTSAAAAAATCSTRCTMGP